MKFNYSIVSFIFCSLFLVNACTKSKVTDLPDSLKTYTLLISHCNCDPFIDEYRWKGETVYLQSCNGPNCDCTTTFYNDKGVKMNLNMTYDQFRLESTFIKNAWTCNTATKGQ